MFMQQNTLNNGDLIINENNLVGLYHKVDNKKGSISQQIIGYDIEDNEVENSKIEVFDLVFLDNIRKIEENLDYYLITIIDTKNNNENRGVSLFEFYCTSESNIDFEEQIEAALTLSRHCEIDLKKVLDKNVFEYTVKKINYLDIENNIKKESSFLFPNTNYFFNKI
jgi:hypothetical protein